MTPREVSQGQTAQGLRAGRGIGLEPKAVGSQTRWKQEGYAWS